MVVPNRQQVLSPAFSCVKMSQKSQVNRIFPDERRQAGRAVHTRWPCRQHAAPSALRCCRCRWAPLPRHLEYISFMFCRCPPPTPPPSQSHADKCGGRRGESGSHVSRIRSCLNSTCVSRDSVPQGADQPAPSSHVLLADTTWSFHAAFQVIGHGRV